MLTEYLLLFNSFDFLILRMCEVQVNRFKKKYTLDSMIDGMTMMNDRCESFLFRFGETF